jgi:5-methylcytosine-specific restriction endonuclease McrA
MSVFVLDKNGKALMPCSEKRARLLLDRGRARVHRVLPFVIRLVDRRAVSCEFQKLRIKLDPGSKVTGIALVCEVEGSIAVLNLIELVHRGAAISKALAQRAGFRRRRRSANLRHRAPRFLNRGNKATGWLAPSLMHRVHTTMAWVRRIQRFAPVSFISTELVRFDMQLMQNAEISGVEYQQGELQGYEVREYLLEKWGRKCAYCNAENTPLQMEHIHCKGNGGSNRVSNLTLACEPCNQKKGSQPVELFLKNKPEVLKRILAQAKKPLKDAAAVNSTRWTLYNTLKETGLPVEAGTGGRTKWNRTRFSIPKTHALDAVCVGKVNDVLSWCKPTLTIKATGRGSYQRTRLTAQGFPRGYLMCKKSVEGFQTGDMVKAIVPSGKKAGTHAGRVAVRATGSFNIQAAQGVIQGVSHRHCKIVQRADGYGYSTVAFMESEQVGHKARIAPRSALYLPGLKAEVSRAQG